VGFYIKNNHEDEAVITRRILEMALAREVSPLKKEVEQLTREGKIIDTYKSTVEAERQTGVKNKGIQKCARGECKTYGGFKWMYT